MKIKSTLTPVQACELARKHGHIELSAGVYLNTQGSILEEQEGWLEDDAKGFDFTKAPMWINTDDGVLLPVFGPDDLDEVLFNVQDVDHLLFRSEAPQPGCYTGTFDITLTSSL